jgi:hypothetical protein
MTMQKIVSVAIDFTRFPSGRYKKNGPTSGEEFRDTFLVPLIRDGNRVKVELDGTIGYGSSFLEEAFGGLVRVLGNNVQDIHTMVILDTSNDVLRQEIVGYIDAAISRLKPSRRA